MNQWKDWEEPGKPVRFCSLRIGIWTWDFPEKRRKEKNPTVSPCMKLSRHKSDLFRKGK
jgi:hypothetical protein